MSFKTVRGYAVPVDDVECCRVVFDTVHDVDTSISLCKNKDICVQAGGNFGVWPAYLADIFRTVYTFEPDPLNFSCLCRNIGDRQNIVKIQGALGNAHGCIDLSRDIKNAGAHYVAGSGPVPTFRIDDLCLDQCDLIVLDIEGFELLALKGSEATIEKYKPVIHVEDKGLSERYGSRKGEIELWLKRWGYGVVSRPKRDVVLCVR